MGEEGIMEPSRSNIQTFKGHLRGTVAQTVLTLENVPLARFRRAELALCPPRVPLDSLSGRYKSLRNSLGGPHYAFKQQLKITPLISVGWGK